MLSIVIPSYNRRKTIIDLLSNIFSQSHDDFEVIVVDDCSPDDTNQYIENEYPQVILIKNAVNSGPAVSRNKGFKVAKGEIVIGFDSDVSLTDMSLLNKVESIFSENQDFTGLAFRVLNPNTLNDDIPRWWHSKPVSSHSKLSFETSYFSGTAYAFRKTDFFAAGGYPEILYMHYEEVLLSWRIIDNGGRIVYCPELEVLHHASPTPRRTLIKSYYKPRNQLLLAALSMSAFKAVKYIVPRLTKNFYKALVNRQFTEFFKAIRSFFSLWNDSMALRQIIKPTTWEKIEKMESK